MAEAKAKKTTETAAKKPAAKKTTKAVKPAEVIVETAVTTEAPAAETVDSKEETKTAKAGKRSTKALKETEEKQAKEERKAAKADAEDAPKAPVKPSRSRLERRGKNFQKAAALIEKDKQYTLKQALDLATKTSAVKFDATVELHVNLGVDPRQADQNVRSTVSLPAGTGKTLVVAVFADADLAAAAKKAGADIAGEEEVTKMLDKEQMNFDVLISTPTNMAKLGKYARMLGPRGLMPNPKSGTVTTDVVKAVTEAKAGRVEFRVDSTGIVHLGFGKVSFGGAKLLENAEAIFAGIRSAKPASVKGTYIKSVHVTTSMGPSIPVATSEL